MRTGRSYRVATGCAFFAAATLQCILGPRDMAPRATLITLQTQYYLSRVKQSAGWSRMLVEEVSDSSKAERV